MYFAYVDCCFVFTVFVNSCRCLGRPSPLRLCRSHILGGRGPGGGSGSGSVSSVPYSPQGWLIGSLYEHMQNIGDVFSPHMALGGLQKAAKYSYGMWERFGVTVGRFQLFLFVCVVPLTRMCLFMIVCVYFWHTPFLVCLGQSSGTKLTTQNMGRY